MELGRIYELLALAVISNLALSAATGLQYGFYKTSCPQAEAIVAKTVAGYFAKDRTVAAPLLRLHFHDCFVRGCDGSVLINSTKSNKAEKDASPNLSLDGFYVIDAAKAALEKQCPGVVSCADISAIAARDSVHLAKGIYYAVQTGRRDGRISLASEAVANLPAATLDFPGLQSIFASKGLDKKDLVVLSGAHTIGQSHCSSIDSRLYNFSGNGGVDLTLDPSYASQLRKVCKHGDTTTTLNMDPSTPTTFDNNYYKLVKTNRALFHSDEALLQDVEAARLVNLFFNSQKSFFAEFGKSMVRMGSFQVLTGKDGEIRKNCAIIN